MEYLVGEEYPMGDENIETVEATFEQALALLVLFFVANIVCRAVVYPLASMACAGRAPAVEPEAGDEEEVE